VPTTLRIDDALEFFVGVWDLDRSIEDHRSGARGTFRGRASLTEMPGGAEAAAAKRLSYEEAGELLFGAYRGPAHRTLEYVRLHDASVMLCFADGRPFIDVDLRAGHCTRIHDCGEDRYEISMAAISHDLMEERWRVRGPKKDYDAVTTLHRVDEEPDRLRR
jgi:Family of unknown function (DUF6314)